jgi:hypothetical protein
MRLPTCENVLRRIPQASPFWIALLYFALPSLLVPLDLHLFGAVNYRPLNPEYLLIGVVCMFVPRPIAFLLLFAEFLAGRLYRIYLIYQLAPVQALGLMRYLPLVPAGRILEAAIMLVLGVGICVILACIRPPEKAKLKTSAVLCSLIAAIVLLDAASGNNPYLRRDTAYGPKLVRCPIASLIVHEMEYRRMEERRVSEEDHPVNSATGVLNTILGGQEAQKQKPNVVLVLVESWGLDRDPRVASALTESYDDPRIAKAYRVVRGSVPFNGLTISGEARELCHSGMGQGIVQASNGETAHCLPALLHARGYQNTAVHGYSGGFYLRNQWYPKLGFDQSVFQPDLEKQGLPQCDGAFVGICDFSIAEWIGRRIRMATPDAPQFVYWVTLNSHIPVPAHPNPSDDGSCQRLDQVRGSQSLCSWFQLIREVHRSVAEQAVELEGRPTVFLLVGDHAPPFAEPEIRAEFSSTEVPFLLITPVSSSPEMDRATGSSPEQLHSVSQVLGVLPDAGRGCSAKLSASTGSRQGCTAAN